MGSDVFICEICGNKDPKYLGIKNGKVYCRRCISFKGREISNEIKFSENIELGISYSLTKEQERISNKILKNYINGFNQLIYAVCGAGKTELVFKVMEYALKNKLHADGINISLDDTQMKATVSVNRNLVNQSYALGWVTATEDYVYEPHEISFDQKVVDIFFGGIGQDSSGDTIFIKCPDIRNNRVSYHFISEFKCTRENIAIFMIK